MSYRNHVYGLKSLLKSVVDARTNKILLTIKWKKCEHGFSKLLRTYYRIVILLRSFQYFQVDQEQFVWRQRFGKFRSLQKCFQFVGIDTEAETYMEYRMVLLVLWWTW